MINYTVYHHQIAFIVGLVLQIAGGVTGALSTSAVMLVLARIPAGIGAVALFNVAFVISELWCSGH